MGAEIAILFVFLVATVRGNSNNTVNYSDVYKNRFCRLTNCPDNMLPHIGCNSTQVSFKLIQNEIIIIFLVNTAV